MTHRFKLCAFRRQKAAQTLRKSVATLLVKVLHNKHTTASIEHDGRNIEAIVRGRKYLTSAERGRFVAASRALPSPEWALFCLTLVHTGARISELLAVTSNGVDLDCGSITLETLKRRRRGVFRHVPVQPDLLAELDRVFGLRALQRNAVGGKLWPSSRSTAWRHVKEVMRAADIWGAPATPKGLRHGFGVAAFAVAPPHLVQRWLGHASLRTTAIYGDVVGAEERAFAERLWQSNVD
jgi:integrase